MIETNERLRGPSSKAPLIFRKFGKACLLDGIYSATDNPEDGHVFTLQPSLPFALAGISMIQFIPGHWADTLSEPTLHITFDTPNATRGVVLHDFPGVGIRAYAFADAPNDGEGWPDDGGDAEEAALTTDLEPSGEDWRRISQALVDYERWQKLSAKA